MSSTLDIVNHFYDVTLKGSAGIDELSLLFAEDATFRGPIQEGNGAAEITDINAAFFPFVKSYNLLAEFENGNDVSIIHEVRAQLPNGEKISMTMSEWFQIKEGLIASHNIYFDPRKFLDIMAAMQE